VLVLVAINGLALLLALSRVGDALSQLPLWGLVLFHVYRLPLELAMHWAATEGTMPSVMSYSGANFDMVTGVLAIPTAYALYRGAPRWLAHLWNLLGATLLINVVTIAVRASPLALAYGPEQVNTWVTYFPFVWLPAVLVLAAFAGHVVTLRALLRPAETVNTQRDRSS
jgi:hypothetical protein